MLCFMRVLNHPSQFAELSLIMSAKDFPLSIFHCIYIIMCVCVRIAYNGNFQRTYIYIQNTLFHRFFWLGKYLVLCYEHIAKVA